MVSISTKRTFSQDGTGLQSIILYPEADNNYAWYSSRNRELMLSENKDYIKYKDKHEKHVEVKMISKIGDMLKGAGFKDDDVVIQGGSAKKAN